MRVFPIVEGLSYPLREPLYKPKNRTEFENGTVSSRARFTRAKKRFVLKWEKLPAADTAILEKFFDEIGGDTFQWAHPLTKKVYRCIISDDEFDANLVELDYYDVTLNIEEI